jgi:hypothetical protein
MDPSAVSAQEGGGRLDAAASPPRLETLAGPRPSDAFLQSVIPAEAVLNTAVFAQCSVCSKDVCTCEVHALSPVRAAEGRRDREEPPPPPPPVVPCPWCVAMAAVSPRLVCLTCELPTLPRLPTVNDTISRARPCVWCGRRNLDKIRGPGGRLWCNACLGERQAV